MSIKQNLIFFKVVKASSKRVTSHLTNFIDVVINASPNLKEVTLPWGFSPDLSNSKYLDSLTIALDNVDPCDIVRAEDKLSNMSRMLSQVRNQLVKLSFDYVDNTYVGYGSTELDDTKNFKKTHFHLPTKKMPKLKTFRNRMTDVFRCDDLLQNIVPNLKSLMIGKAFQKSKSVDDIVQNICLSKKKVLPNMTNLRVMQLHDPKLLKRLVTVFPNLEKLKLDTFDTRDSGGKKTLLKLGVVLKTCRGWRVLKHLGLRLPKYPKQVEDVIQALLKAKKLFKQLKTLSLGTCKFDNKIHDLSANEIDLFKQLLVAIRGMDRVGIAGIYYGKESAESIRAFMALNEMRVSKFSVVEEESEETDADSVNYDGDYNWSMDGDSSVDFEFSDDWHESYDDWCESYDDDSD
ncbi:hypothetical protein Fcan01_01667 [Folsomia candida]|uniref:Uncharacterized protein n=2 Tax=Folsomia candida TaxID=158441 RepID=A0A226F526_FOLCA|nr:hypothetical protein Fcan01_01667 [Folsomia candida]